MNQRLARNYRNVRRDNPTYGAATALAVARRMDPPPWAADLAYNGTAFEGTVNGTRVRIGAEADEPDISWLGTFTDDPTDAIPNTQAGRASFEYFRPEPGHLMSQGEIARTHGKARAADLYAAQCEAIITMALAEQSYVWVQVCDDDGIDLGESGIGGVYIDDTVDILWSVDDHGLISEAIDDAARNAHDDAA